MSSLELTREWLQTVLRPYPSRDRLVPEILDILTQRRTLSVKTDAFTFDSGNTALLLLLHGTLPIEYRGATYHIPIHIWVPMEYPRTPPLAFVVPTKDMGVRKSKEVDPGGKVREEVVAEWWRSWSAKSIEMLLRQLTSIFSAAPPVFARPPENTVRSPVVNSASGSQSPPPPAPSRPGTANRQTSMTSPTVSPAQPPPPPARPSFAPPQIQTEFLPQYQPAPNPPPHTASPLSTSRQASASYPARPPQSPPVPNRPAQTAPYPQGSPTVPAVPQRPYVQYAQPPNGPSFVPSPHQPPAPMTPPRQEPSPAHLPQHSYPSQHWQTQPVFSNGYNHAQALPPQQLSMAYPQQSMPSSVSAAQPPTSQLTLKPRQPIHDLLSSPEQSSSSLPAVSDTPGTSVSSPPPLPPSKPPPPSLLHLHAILLPHLAASLPPLLSSLNNTRAHLIERKEDLGSGEPAIRDEMARLEAVKKVCDSVGKKMEDVVHKGQERVAELEARGEVSVDEVVCGISIVHNQLIDLVAEDNAIEDTIYHMTRALDAERIDLDRFLKSIRTLAREQYMKRALIERILQGMGQKQGW
ncbi:UEV domain-domain-containing protein [Naematelia encephala]|uniref:UEV domain-domain-containing protein n=1 Tax=Naematelia encephala TaxID=71784 RepID=A0A1Y2AMN7_9TREE|nr:UEV domain-domain-containing protein [Naematelia encephala]